MEKRLANLVDDKATETKRVTQEVLTKSLEAVKYDYETIINRLGQQVQELITRVKQEQTSALTSTKREFEDSIWTFKNEVDDMLKSTKAATAEELLRLREDMRTRIDDSEMRTHKQFSKLLDDTTQAIEDSINANLVAQMKELDLATKDAIQRINSLDAQALVHAEKTQRLEEAAADHIDLIESLNRKVDKQVVTIEDNKALIIDKLAVFQSGVINELKEATSHFSFKAYEESFRKIEMDMDTFYKELLKLREDNDSKGSELSEWKQKLGIDLLNFYKKYDNQSTDAQSMTRAERDTISTLITEMADNISKSKSIVILMKIYRLKVNPVASKGGCGIPSDLPSLQGVFRRGADRESYKQRGQRQINTRTIRTDAQAER